MKTKLKEIKKQLETKTQGSMNISARDDDGCLIIFMQTKREAVDYSDKNLKPSFKKGKK